MTRKAAREIAVRLVFAGSENMRDPLEVLGETFDEEYYASLIEEDEIYAAAPDKKQLSYIGSVVRGVYEHSAELDGYIERYSTGWKFERISRTAIAVMKTAMFEILYMPDVPTGVAINEALEISKKYDEPETSQYINGVLGAFAKSEVI